MLLEKLVEQMSTKKVIVFIVEGKSDKESLNSIVSELYSDKEIVFSVVRSDITTKFGSKTNNIESKIAGYIKKAMDEDKFLWKDIERVVHLVDTDGAFIPDDHIKYSQTKEYIYTENNIETMEVEKARDRNKQKKGILNKLSTLHKIYRGLRYDVYYMSCNLEDVLHNIKNATDTQKEQLSHKFEEIYCDNPEAFVEFLNNSEFAVQGTFRETWEYIKRDLNSLRRHSNFHKFFDDEK